MKFAPEPLESPVPAALHTPFRVLPSTVLCLAVAVVAAGSAATNTGADNTGAWNRPETRNRMWQVRARWPVAELLDAGHVPTPFGLRVLQATAGKLAISSNSLTVEISDVETMPAALTLVDRLVDDLGASPLNITVSVNPGLPKMHCDLVLTDFASGPGD